MSGPHEAEAVAGRTAVAGQLAAASRQIDATRLATVRILLAEDNATNQQVALGILKQLGMRADAVANGAEAVRSLATIPYDLVLMDVQMPEMDGLAATRRIRDPRSEVLQHEIPIIAMTANALQGDRELCLEAGMNDYVTKPIFKPALTEALQRWLPRENAAAQDGAAPVQAPVGPSAAPPVAVETAPAPVFDREGMLARMDGDEDLCQMVVDGFLEDMPGQLASLRSCLDTNDITGALRQVHTIKGASANVGGEALRAVAINAESAGKTGGLDAVRTRLTDLELQFDRLEEAMREFAGPKGPGPGELP